MFQDILESVREGISTIRKIIKTNNELRDIINRQKSEEELRLLTQLIQNIPDAKDWEMYEHCAVVTRLYAIYESFVEDLITDWLAILPRIYINYSDLEERIRTTHQIGVGKLLVNLNKNRYESLSIEEVMRGIYRGLNHGEGYELLANAFLIYEQNLRKEILEKLLADAGIPNVWSWLEKHRAVKYFLQELRGNENTVENELNELISYRNDAAHGGIVEDVLDSEALIELCDFIEALCEALTELVTYRVIERQKFLGYIKEVGKITEWFKTPQAGVAKILESTLSVGESIFLVGEACCQLSKIQSINIDDKPINMIEATSEIEVGLKFNMNAKKGLRIYK
jgi:MAE_28990/MAE_18760-like HEPN